MAIIKVITPSVTDANITTAKVTDNAITLAKMASGTDGNIISYDASGNPVAVATGSDGQVLTSTGAGSPPAFEAIPGGGKIGQVVSETKTSTFDTTSSSLVDISGLAVSLTPSASSSKVLIFCSIYFGRGNGNSGFLVQLLRGSTILGAGAGSGNRQTGIATIESTLDTYTMNSSSFNFLDSPSTSNAVTYKIQTKSRDGSEVSINASSADPNLVYGQRVSSTITAMEVLA